MCWAFSKVTAGTTKHVACNYKNYSNCVLAINKHPSTNNNNANSFLHQSLVVKEPHHHLHHDQCEQKSQDLAQKEGVNYSVGTEGRGKLFCE